MASAALDNQEVSSDLTPYPSPSSPPSYDDEGARNVADELETDVETSQSQSLTTNITPVESNRRLDNEKSSGKQMGMGLLSPGEYHWNIEIAAIVLSISSMVAILILLPMYEDQPLSSWPLPVSLNVIISVLGATSRASLAFAISACISQGKWNWYRKRNDSVMVFDRFEEASRGPWGSLRLLWWTKLRYVYAHYRGTIVLKLIKIFRHWTALGALAAVVLVGFEPFLQAVVTISGEEITLAAGENTSIIGRTKTLDSGICYQDGGPPAQALVPPWNPLEIFSFARQYDFGALSAIWEGFSDLNTAENQKPTFYCPSRNCTWPIYASLAVCSACNDVSSHITKTSGGKPIANKTVPEMVISNNVRPTMLAELWPNFTKYEIKSQKLMINGPNGFQSEWYPTPQLTAQSTYNPGETISFRHLKTLILSFSILKSDKRFVAGSKRWEDSPATAEECALYFCTNIYRSTVQQSVLREDVLGSFANRNLDSYDVGYVPERTSPERSRALNQQFNYSLLYGNAMVWRTDLQLTISREEYFATTKTTIGDDLRFNVTRNTTCTLLDWFLNEFSRRRDSSDAQLIYPDPNNEKNLPAVIDMIGKSQNLKKTFENVAASLTKWIRNRSMQTEPFVGTSTEWVIRIRINWGFLTLPIGALLGGCLFCLLSIWETRRVGLPAWRGSSLATLAHGLDMRSRAILREASDSAQIATRARGLEVKFEDSEGGPELTHDIEEIHRTHGPA